MRVLHVYSGNLYGGIESILVTLARQARACRDVTHEFALCFTGRLQSELEAAHATVHPLAPVRLSRPQTAAAARRALAQLLARETFDRVICHAPWSQAFFGGVVVRAGVPLVFWAHDVMTGRHWTERLARRTVPELVIGNSAFTLTTLDALYPGATSAVVYAPVDVDTRVRDDAERATVRAELDTPLDAIVIVQASRAESWKGHRLLVDALAEIQNLPGWIWWQAGGAQRPGEAEFLDQVRLAATRKGMAERVRWLGQRSDVGRLFAAADVYCQANTSPEPFGVVFVEALASGLPVVTTNMGGAKEIVDGSCGVLVAPDAHDVAAALCRLISDPAERRRLAESAPARAAALSSPARQCDRLTSVLDAMSRVEAHA
jgi:glycosyltransferase involved in cell wall biosynthesis